MKTQRPLFLSVDWDFFVKEDPMWDWGHAESPLYLEFMWQHRLAEWFAKDRDLRKECALAECDPQPRDFWATLKRLGYKINKKTVVHVGESHAQAAGPFLRAAQGRRVDVLHFDAHHDSGYGDPQEIRNRVRATLDKTGQVDCGSWLLALALEVETCVTYVYPKWKGDVEWKSQMLDEKTDARLNEFVDHQMLVYDEDKLTKAVEPRAIDQIFICRSGAWTPPWLDSFFFGFCGGLYGKAGEMYTLPIGKISPLDFRKVDIEAARNSAEEMREQMAEILEKTRPKDKRLGDSTMAVPGGLVKKLGGKR